MSIVNMLFFIFLLHSLYEKIALSSCFSEWLFFRKITFEIIWYSVIFAATLYSSDHLICWASLLWILSFLFIIKSETQKIARKYHTHILKLKRCIHNVHTHPNCRIDSLLKVMSICCKNAYIFKIIWYTHNKPFLLFIKYEVLQIIL